MLFLKSEVKSEERISMARGGFGDQTKKIQRKDHEDRYDIPSAAGVMVGSTNNRSTNICIFCDGIGHWARQCLKAKKMTYEERKKTCERCGGCFSCLTKGHLSKCCPNKDRLKCKNCEGQHYLLMCPSNAKKRFEKANTTLSKSKEVVESLQTSNLLIEEQKEESMLSTLLVRIRNGNRSVVVRAAIYSGSHKTYMLKRVIKDLGLQQIGQEILIHELFGGLQMKETEHRRYRVVAENLDGS